MQILHRFSGSIQQYSEEISGPHRYRPEICPQCQARCPLTAHGFYCRSLVDVGFDGAIRVRRYLCRVCQRTVSLLPSFALPYLRFGISMISLFLRARPTQGSQFTRSGGGRSSTENAIPARPVLGTAISTASHGFVRSLGQLDGSRARDGFCNPGFADARSHWLD